MKKILIIGTLLLGMVLGIGIFAVAQSMSAPVAAQEAPAPEAAAPEASAGGPRIIVAVEENINGEITSGEVEVFFEEAEELPDVPADLFGLFVSRNGDTLTLGTGLIEVTVDVEVTNDDDPVTTINATYDGDEVQVLVTADTVIYADVTEPWEVTPEDIAAGEKYVQREVAPGSLDEIGDNMELQVWGSLQNGVLVADTLVYQPIR